MGENFSKMYTDALLREQDVIQLRAGMLHYFGVDQPLAARRIMIGMREAHAVFHAAMNDIIGRHRLRVKPEAIVPHAMSLIVMDVFDGPSL